MSIACEHDRLASELAAAHAEIRRLRLRLALATSRLTWWQRYSFGGWWNNSCGEVLRWMNSGQPIRLGDGTPEQEQPHA